MNRRHENTAVHHNMFGYRGVEWNQSRGKFRARIEGTPGQRGKWLGRYETAEGAARAYDEAAREMYGAEAYFNFPMPGEKSVMASRIKDGFCPKGHDLSVYGYSASQGMRCRKCNLAAVKRYKTRQKAACP